MFPRKEVHELLSVTQTRSVYLPTADFEITLRKGNNHKWFKAHSRF
jgi:hypothetical protein